jgi:hypothetical protein
MCADGKKMFFPISSTALFRGHMSAFCSSLVQLQKAAYDVSIFSLHPKENGGWLLDTIDQ